MLIHLVSLGLEIKLFCSPWWTLVVLICSIFLLHLFLIVCVFASCSMFFHAGIFVLDFHKWFWIDIVLKLQSVSCKACTMKLFWSLFRAANSHYFPYLLIFWLFSSENSEKCLSHLLKVKGDVFHVLFCLSKTPNIQFNMI